MHFSDLDDAQRLKIASLINELSRSCNQVETLKSDLEKITLEKHNLETAYKTLNESNNANKLAIKNLKQQQNDDLHHLENKLKEVYEKLKIEKKKRNDQNVQFEACQLELAKVNELNNKMKLEFLELQRSLIEKEAALAEKKRIDQAIDEVQNSKNHQDRGDDSTTTKNNKKQKQINLNSSRNLNSIENALLGIKEQILECANLYTDRTEKVLKEALVQQNSRSRSTSRGQEFCLDPETSKLADQLNLTNPKKNLQILARKDEKLEEKENNGKSDFQKKIKQKRFAKLDQLDDVQDLFFQPQK